MRRLVKRNPPSAISHPPAITTVVVNSRDMAKARGKNFGPPMTLANMRHNGVRAVIARCEACGHASDVNVDAFAETITVPRSDVVFVAAGVEGSRSIRGPHGIPPTTRGASAVRT